MKPFTLAVIAVLLGTFLGGATRGDMLYTPPSDPALIRTDGGFTMGTEFTVAADGVKVTDLGVWDEDGDGLVSSHDIGIYQVNTSNNTGTLLVSTTVDAGTVDPLVDGFRYVTLTTPVALVNGDTYRIGAFYRGDEAGIYEPFQQVETVTFASAFTTSAAYDGERYSTLFGLHDPTLMDAGGQGKALVGPNFLFTTPEPASLSLVAVGATLLLRRKR